MKTVFQERNGVTIAEVEADGIVIHDVQDALDLLANCSYQGAGKIIILENQLVPEFFELRSGLAGEILQKFSTYQVQLAIVGDYSRFTSQSLRDFMYESNKMGHIYFVGSREEAREKLAK